MKLFPWRQKSADEKLNLLLKIGANNLATLADIKTKVDALSSTVATAVTTLNTLSADLKAAQAANDPAAMQAIIDSVDASEQQLAAAIAANPPPTA